MWSKIKPLILMLSLALNLAFILSWAAHQLPSNNSAALDTAPRMPVNCADCPLHQALGTNETQRREISSLQERFRDSSQMLCGRLCQTRSELIDLIAAASADPAAIQAKQDAIFSDQRRMEDLVVQQLLTEKALLTPAQQEKLFSMIRFRCGCPANIRTASTPEPGTR